MASSNSDSINMAVFCDFENVALGVRDANYEQFDIRPVLERLLLKGSIVVKKAYCDWDRYKGFKKAMHEANFELIEIPHVRQSGKNSADIRLVVDALDLCYTKAHVDTFVIVSGDSDFSPLVSKLRENAKQVIGVGVKQSTSDLLIANCDEFIFYDDLVREQARKAGRRQGNRDAAQGSQRVADDEKPRKEDQESRRTKAVELAVETFDALSSERGDTNKIWASVLKDAIKRRKPDFNESYFGFRAFGNLLDEAQSRGLLQVGRDERSGTYVYRDAGSLAQTAADSQPESNQPGRETRRTDSASAPATTEAKATEAASAQPGNTAGKAQEKGRGRARRQSKRNEAPESVAALPTVEQTAAGTGQVAAATQSVSHAGQQPAPAVATAPDSANTATDAETSATRAAQHATNTTTAPEAAQQAEATPTPAKAKRPAPRKRAGRKTSAQTSSPANTPDAGAAAQAEPASKTPNVATPPAATASGKEDASNGNSGAAVSPAPSEDKPATARKTATRSRRPRKAAAADTKGADASSTD